MSVEPLRKSTRVTPERFVQLEMRVTGCEQALTKLPGIEADAKTARENTEQILAVVSGGKSAVKFLQKHGGRVVAFAVGLAVARGWIGQDLANLFSSLFGLH